LVSSVRDPPLVSSCAAGIPKPVLTNPPVLEVFAALPITGVTLWCFWALYTTAESPEVVAYAAEPPVFSEAAMPAAVSPEVAAYAAEPCEMGTSASALCTVVAPSDTPSTCELLSCPVPATYELSARPVTAMEAVSELSAHPVTAM
ncbi:hypothetical protein M9458_019237, partial [Cirrhinus mrigala]